MARLYNRTNSLYIYHDNTFKPNQLITPAEFIEILTWTLYRHTTIQNGLYAIEPMRAQKPDEHWGIPYIEYTMPNFPLNPSLVSLYSNISNLDKPMTKYNVIIFSASAFVQARNPSEISNSSIMTWEEADKIYAQIKDLGNPEGDDDLAIIRAITLGWDILDENNNFNPNKTMTRAEAIKFLSLVPR